MKSISLTLLATLNDDRSYTSRQLLDAITGIRAQQTESSEVNVTEQPLFITASCQAIIVVGDSPFYIRYDNALTRGLVHGPTNVFTTSGTLSNVQMYAPNGQSSNVKIILASGPEVYAPVQEHGYVTYIDLANTKSDIEKDIADDIAAAKPDLSPYALTTSLTSVQNSLQSQISKEAYDRQQALSEAKDQSDQTYARKTDLAEEANSRDSAIKAAISQEVRDRNNALNSYAKAADVQSQIATLQDTLDGHIDSEVSNLSEAITTANNQLANSILQAVNGNGNNGETPNASDIATFATKVDLSSETVMRQQADTALDKRIDKEISDRQQAISNIPSPDVSNLVTQKQLADYTSKQDAQNFATKDSISQAVETGNQTLDSMVASGNTQIVSALQDAIGYFPVPSNGDDSNPDIGTASLDNEVAARQQAIIALRSYAESAIGEANNKISALAEEITPAYFPRPCPVLPVPDGWLSCDGKSFDVSRHPQLAVAFPDGVLPDMRGVFLRGYDPLGTYDPDGPTRKVGVDVQKGSLSVYGGQDGDMVSFSGPDASLGTLALDKLPNGYRAINPYWSGPGSEKISTNNNMGRTRPYNIACVWVVRAA